MTSRPSRALPWIAAALLTPLAASAPDAGKGNVHVVTVHGASLEGNLTPRVAAKC